MLELDSTYPDQEDLTLAFNRCMSNIRDNLTDLEILFKRIFEGKTYIDEEAVCKVLRCKSTKEIPARLPRYRCNKVGGYLFKVSEIYSFIESKRIKGSN